MIYFEDWSLRVEGQVIAQQFDHLTRTLTVIGDLPQGWEWVMIVKLGQNMDYLPLNTVEGGIGAELTAQQFPFSGSYRLQLRGRNGEKVRHTNIITVRIETSFSGDVQWPEIPSHFSVLERRIVETANDVKGFALNPPVLGENGNWQLWNGEAYEDAGYSPIDSLLAALPVYDGEVEAV